MNTNDLEKIDHLIKKIEEEAEDDDGQLWVFRRVVRENLKLPIDGWVIGEPVQVVEVDYKGIPQQEYWWEPDEPIEDWAKPIIAFGPRRQFEMEQILPGAGLDIDDPFSDPITDSNTLKEGGDYKGARRILMDLCQTDLRCLDAHAHLGNLLFDSFPEQAIRHYEAGVRIGELSLDQSFKGI